MPRRLIQLGFIGWLCSSSVMAACGGDDDGEGGSSHGGSSSTGGGSGTGGSGGACVNIAGTWTVSKHCVAALVNQQVQVTQTGCMFSSTGISGTIGANGMFTASGMIPMVGNATCTGTATATMVTQDCTVAGAPCAVTLTR